MTKLFKMIKRVLNGFGVDTKSTAYNVLSWSIKSAIKEQKLGERCSELKEIIPDISNQYSHGFSKEDYENYFELKMRGMHAFQVNACIDTVNYVFNKLNKPITIADIGDSSGNHLRYLKHIVSEKKLKKGISVNLDPVAIEKINAEGGEWYFMQSRRAGYEKYITRSFYEL